MSYTKLGLAALTGVAAAYGLSGGRARGRRVEVGTDTLNPVQDAVFRAVKRAAPSGTKWRVIRGKQHPITGYEDWDGEMMPIRDESRLEPDSTRGLQLITDNWRSGDRLLRDLSGAYGKNKDVAIPALTQAMEKQGWHLRKSRWSAHISTSAFSRGTGRKNPPYLQVVGPGHLIAFTRGQETTVLAIGVGPWRTMYDDYSESSVLAPDQSKAYPILFVGWWGNSLREALP